MKRFLIPLLFLALPLQAQQILGSTSEAAAAGGALPDQYVTVTSVGADKVGLDTAVGSVTPGTSATSLGKAEDAATASGHVGVGILGVVQTAPAAAGSITANDYTFPNIDSATGGFYVVPSTSTARVCAAITPDTAAFQAGDIVGATGGVSGLLTFANIFKAVNLSGILTSIEVTNTEIDGIAFNLTLFSADPTGSTVASNGALTIVAADLQKWLGTFSVSDGVAVASTELYQAQGLSKAIKGASTSLYAILRTTGAPTWAAAQTVNVCLTVIQD